jgi:hypothetical protein
MVVHDLAVRGISYSTVHGSLEERIDQVKAILAGRPGIREKRRD